MREIKVYDHEAELLEQVGKMCSTTVAEVVESILSDFMITNGMIELVNDDHAVYDIDWESVYDYFK